MSNMAAEAAVRREFNLRIVGLNFHRVIFPVSLFIILALVSLALYDPQAFGATLEGVKGWILLNFDWFIIIMGNLAVLFCALLALSPLGKVRLGGSDARPEYSTLSWFSMMFAAGMGVGLLYWGVAEPVAQYTAWFKTPLDVAANTPQAAELAMAASLYHWGLHPWALYLTTAIVVGFFCFNRGLPLSLSSGLEPLIGKAYKGLPGQLVDVFTVVLTVFGLATSLGLGAMQATAGIAHVLGIPNNFAMQLLFIAVVTGVAAFALWRGMHAGIKLLSNLNIFLALGLFLLVVIGIGWQAFFADAFAAAVDYVRYFVPLSNWLERDDQEWMQGWTVFYWAWWCTWGPLVGVFVARVSRGRTLRQMVGMVMLAPTVVAVFWFTALGGGAIGQVAAGTGALANGLSDVNMAIFQFLEVLPLSAITALLVVVLLVIFMVTSVASGALVVDNLSAGGDPDTCRVQRVLWLVMIGLVTVMLFVVGGDTALKGIQAGAVAMGLPFMVLMLLIMIGLIKALISEHRQMARAA
jgi:betaine/carnitine transporter, BCCT family